MAAMEQCGEVRGLSVKLSMHEQSCSALVSPLTSDSCFLSCALISEAERLNVAQCNPIGIDFNQDNVPACLITLSERSEMAKDRLPNVLQARMEKTVQCAHNWCSKSLLCICLYSRFKQPKAQHTRNTLSYVLMR